MANKKKPYERLARDTYNVQPNRYYIWTWRPKEYWGRFGLMANYKKHYCAQPFYTRYHAKKTAILHLGVDALSYIKVISGKSLIKQGITKFLYKKWRYRVFYKGIPVGMPPWIMPPEYRYHKQQRYSFRRKLYDAAKQGRKKFNEFYAFALYGYTQNLDKKYLARQRLKKTTEILRSLQKTGDI